MTSVPHQANKTATALKEEVPSQAPILPVQGAKPPPYSSLPNGNAIRARYLSRLGIVAKPPSNKVIPSRVNLLTQNKMTKPQRPKANKTCHQAKESRKGRSVSFDDAVAIRFIPARFQYPLEIRKDLWGSKEDMIYSVRRNAAEFAAEGWNWQRVVEDHEMFRGDNGELIHPIHFAYLRRFSVQRQFLVKRAQATALYNGNHVGHSLRIECWT
jgi:hypothetical protein